MKKLILLWNLVTLMSMMNSLEIKMDPDMKAGEPSYIYCDVGAVTAGVTFYTEPKNIQGNCFALGVPCSSTIYTIKQNTTGVLLEIASVDLSRDKGEWYCQHDTDRSNTISVNEYTTRGNLVQNDFSKPKPSGKVDNYTAIMVLSCTSTLPSYEFSFSVNGSSSKPVPKGADSYQTVGTYKGQTCEDGKNFYEIKLTASNNIDAFNNKQRVKFFFTFDGGNVEASFSVDFLEAAIDASDGLDTGPIVAIVVVCVALVTMATVAVVVVLKKKKMGCFK